MSIPEEHIQKVMQLLDTWNPLGDRSNSVEDLDNYRTEAIDILFHLDMGEPNDNPTRVVRDVLNEAFGLTLSLDECQDVAQKIAKCIKWNVQKGSENSNS